MPGSLKQALALMGAVWIHPANRGRRPAAMMRALGWQLYRRLVRAPLSISFHGQRLLCYPDSRPSSAALYFGGLPDYWEMRFVLDYLRPGDGFLDIGANVGLYSLLAASRVTASGFVDAVEPFDCSADRLERQLAINGLHNIAVHRMAVGDRRGTVDFGLSEDHATLHVRRKGETRRHARQVPSMRLDEWVGDRTYALGKIDIEGAEPLAFRGAENMLAATNPPVWVMEAAGYSKLYGVSTAELLAFLEVRGFQSMTYDPLGRRLEQVPRPWERGLQNVLMVSRRRAAEVAGRLQSQHDQ